MSPITNPTLLYVKVPKGVPTLDTFKLDDSATVDLDQTLNGGFITKLTCISVDPYLRARMRDPSISSYSEAFTLDKPIQNFAVSEIVKSETEAYKVGDHVYGVFPSQAYVVHPKPEKDVHDALIGPTAFRVLKNEEKLAWTTYIGAAGMPGKTAYMGWKEIAEAGKGQTAFVSAGSGAVGQIVIQLAKQDGMKVIASAGSDAKVEFCKSVGADVAFNYKTEDEKEVLKKAGGGIDVNWVNVGGEAFETELEFMNPHGRLIFCGWISSYNGNSYGVRNLFNIVGKRLKAQGLIVGDFESKYADDFYATIPKKLASGELVFKEAIYKGLESLPQAFLDMLDGTAHGKVAISLE